MSRLQTVTPRIGQGDAIVVREQLLQEKLDGKVRCNTCERRCVIIPGGFGWCRTRWQRRQPP